MHEDKLFFLKTGTCKLTDETKLMLFETAQAIIFGGHKSQKVTGENMEAEVSIEQEHASMVNVSGAVFRASIQTDHVETEVSYLIPHHHFKKDEQFWNPPELKLSRTTT